MIQFHKAKYLLILITLFPACKGLLHKKYNTYNAKGEKVGWWIIPLEHGTMIAKYKHGKKNGKARIQTTDSTMYSIAKFKDDKLNGPMIHYYGNGKVCGIYIYRNDTIYYFKKRCEPIKLK